MKQIIIGVIVLVVLFVAGTAYRQAGEKKNSAAENTAKEESMSPTSQPQVAGSKTYNSPPQMTIDTAKTYTAVLTTNKGVMRVALFAKDAPNTVNNFVFLSRDGYYANTPFHRIIRGFMIQGGDPTGTGRGNPGYRFDDEAITRDYTRGTIAMANSGPNTNGSQFFIMHEDYALPKNYVIFGSIDQTDTQSLKTLDAIASVPVTDNGMGEESKPAESVVLQKVEIEEK